MHSIQRTSMYVYDINMVSSHFVGQFPYMPNYVCLARVVDQNTVDCDALQDRISTSTTTSAMYALQERGIAASSLRQHGLFQAV